MRLVVFCVAFLWTSFAYAQPLPIIPYPQEVTYLEEKPVAIGQLGPVEGAEEDSVAIRMLQETDIPKASGTIPVRLRTPREDEAERFAVRNRDEAYILDIRPEGVAIVAPTAKGRFYGAMSLLQLLRAYSEQIPSIHIVDYPAFALRGISDDISRGQVSTMEDFRRIIRFLAEHKMNVYMPYMEDVFRFKRFPDIGRGRGALTAEEWRALQEYAVRYHVEVIPIFQTLGHFENILNMEPYVRYAEYPGAASLNPLDPEAFAFLKAMLEEVVPTFSSKYFHMGADESWDIGLGASRKAAQRYGTGTVHARHYKKVYIYLKQKGKKVMMYGDMLLRHRDILAQIPRDIIVVDWQYYVADRYPSAEVFAEAGQPFIVSPGIQNWNRLYPDQAAAWLNICQFSREGYRTGAQGVITSNWGDYGGPNFRALNYRGYAYGAECSWNPVHADGESIDTRFNRLFYGTTASSLRTIQELLTEMSRTLSFPEFWRHPERVRLEWGRNTLVRTRLLQQHAASVQEAIEAVASRLTRHTRHLDYHRLIADMFAWKADAVALTQWLDLVRWLYIAPEQRKELVQTGVQRLDTLIERIQTLRERYRVLWLRTNRPDNLERIGKLFTYQEMYLRDMQDRLKHQRWTVPYTLPGSFITATHIPEGTGPTTAYLRYRFRPHGKIRQATVQLIGDSHAKLWLNGTYLGEVRATRSLSLWVEMQRVYMRDVTEQVQSDGENVLAVEVTSYQDERPAAAHVLLVLTYADGRIEHVVTNTYWKTHLLPVDTGWQELSYDDTFWLPAKEVEFFQRVGPSLFPYGLPARIEF